MAAGRTCLRVGAPCGPADDLLCQSGGGLADFLMQKAAEATAMAAVDFDCSDGSVAAKVT